MSHARGKVRDAIMEFLADHRAEATTAQIQRAIDRRLGAVPASSVRSSLQLRAHDQIERVARGRYRLRLPTSDVVQVRLQPAIECGRANLFHADCFDWLAARDTNSVHAVVTDPPYGVVEYSGPELAKLRAGSGGVWRIPPSFDGHKRAPLPRFTTLRSEEREALSAFFRKLGTQLARVLVPGGNVVLASNPLLSHLVMAALEQGGLEPRGYISRLTMTMRGGDRPKNAHEEFDDVSVLPRSQWEPWLLLRNPVEGRVQDNLRKWGTGGFRRLSGEKPFGDVIKSAPTNRAERELAPHPSLKPRAFLRQVVRGALPLGRGVVLDPFAGSGSTLAAANVVGYESIGIEADAKFVRIAETAMPALARLKTVEQA